MKGHDCEVASWNWNRSKTTLPGLENAIWTAVLGSPGDEGIEELPRGSTPIAKSPNAGAVRLKTQTQLRKSQSRRSSMALVDCVHWGEFVLLRHSPPRATRSTGSGPIVQCAMKGPDKLQQLVKTYPWGFETL